MPEIRLFWFNKRLHVLLTLAKGKNWRDPRDAVVAYKLCTFAFLYAFSYNTF